jgi:peptidoglycan/xylan/chitin deacetylase (PgdA/CDA1 family)
MRYFAPLLFLFVLSGCGTASPPSRESGEEIIFRQETPDAIDAVAYAEIGDEFSLPILLLHHIGEPPPSASADARTWYVSVEKFKEMLDFLEAEGYHTLFPSEALDFIEAGRIPERAVILSFDDGAVDFYTHAWPLLEAYDAKAAVSVMTGVGGDNWLNEDQIKELDASGLVEFQSHTRYHAYLTRISENEAREELEASKAFLEALLDKPVRVIAYPFGLYDDAIISIARELGYEAGFTLRSGSMQEKDDLFRLKRMIITNGSDFGRMLKTE